MSTTVLTQRRSQQSFRFWVSGQLRTTGSTLLRSMAIGFSTGGAGHQIAQWSSGALNPAPTTTTPSESATSSPSISISLDRCAGYAPMEPRWKPVRTMKPRRRGVRGADAECLKTHRKVTVRYDMDATREPGSKGLLREISAVSASLRLHCAARLGRSSVVDLEALFAGTHVCSGSPTFQGGTP